MRLGLNHVIRPVGIGLLTIVLTACGTADMPKQYEEIDHASWTISADESGLTFITIHNQDVAEINTFREIIGNVSSNGKAIISIPLDSIDSNDQGRDALYKSVLFETDQYPYLTASADLDMQVFDGLAIGERHTELLDLTLDLHGVKSQRPFYVMVTRLDEDKVLVENKAPLLVKASDFDLGRGLTSMAQSAGVDDVVPVATITLSLVFVPNR